MCLGVLISLGMLLVDLHLEEDGCSMVPVRRIGKILR
jgi:hypothetical protein